VDGTQLSKLQRTFSKIITATERVRT